MNLTFDKSRWTTDRDGLWLCLRVDKPQEARRLCDAMERQPEKKYQAEIKQYRKKRSLDANAYCWVLLHKLSAAVGLPAKEIYRNLIPDIGGNCETVCLQERAAEWLKKSWESHGIGWVTESMPSKLPGCVNLILYSGSSSYDTAQMSRLVDLVVQECKQLDIETATPDELALMKARWEDAEQTHKGADDTQGGQG